MAIAPKRRSPISTMSDRVSVSAVASGWRFYRADTGNEPPPEKSDEAAIAAMTKFFHDGLAGLKQKAETK